MFLRERQMLGKGNPFGWKYLEKLLSKFTDIIFRKRLMVFERC